MLCEVVYRLDQVFADFVLGPSKKKRRCPFTSSRQAPPHKQEERLKIFDMYVARVLGEDETDPLYGIRHLSDMDSSLSFIQYPVAHGNVDQLNRLQLSVEDLESEAMAFELFSGDQDQD